MSVALLALLVAALTDAVPAPPPLLRYRAILVQQQTIDLSSLDEGTQVTERRDTVYAQIAVQDSAGGHLVLIRIDSVAFQSADLPEIPPDEIQRLRGATSQFFFAPDGLAARQTVLVEGGGIAAGIYAGLLDVVPRVRGTLAVGSSWSDSSETIQLGDEDWRHSRFRTNYLVAPGRELRAAFAGSHARLNGTAEIRGTSTGTLRWMMGADRMPLDGARRETQTLLWKDDELPAPLPLTIVNEVTIARLPG